MALALSLAVALKASNAASAIGSSNGTTAIPERSINSCRVGMELLPLREISTICVSNNVTAEISRSGAEMIARR